MKPITRPTKNKKKKTATAARMCEASAKAMEITGSVVSSTVRLRMRSS
ncbi:MAG: hypothetical protein K0U53_06220 [Betaproteobacteria bacterium]|nr:hypothetical protein [Betaproteobacteria bacterium]